MAKRPSKSGSRKAGTKPRAGSKKTAFKAAKSAAKSAAKMVGAKFGGVFKRKPPPRIHLGQQNDYRETPFFKNPKFIAKPSTLTLQSIYNSTPEPAIRTVYAVHLKSVRPARVPKIKGLEEFKSYRCKTWTSENKHHHEVVFMFLPDERGRLTAKSRVVVSCTCSWNKYFCEYANARKGASFIYYSNGMPPLEKNPRMVPSLCKHSLRLAKYLLQGAGAAKRAPAHVAPVAVAKPLARPASAPAKTARR